MSLSRIVTVLSPAFDTNLIDLDTLKSELKIDLTNTDDDDFLNRAITQVSARVQQYCNRPAFARESIEEVINLPRDSYRRTIPDVVEPLQLSRWPIIDVQSVTQTIALGTTEALTEDADYAVSKQPGQLIRLSTATGQVIAWKAQMPVTVVYDSGYEDIPQDIIDATLRLAVNRWFSRARDPLLLEQVTPLVGTQRWWVGGPKQGGSLPQEVAGMLDQYRVPVTA